MGADAACRDCRMHHAAPAAKSLPTAQAPEVSHASTMVREPLGPVEVDIGGVSVTFPRAPKQSSTINKKGKITFRTKVFRVMVGDTVVAVTAIDSLTEGEWRGDLGVDSTVAAAIDALRKEEDAVSVRRTAERPFDVGDMRGRDVSIDVETRSQGLVHCHIISVGRQQLAFMMVCLANTLDDPLLETVISSIKLPAR